MWQRLLLCHRRHHHQCRQRHRPLHTWWADGVSSFTASLPTHEHVLCSHRCLQRSVATPPNILAYTTASHWEYVNALLLVDFLSCSNSQLLSKRWCKEYWIMNTFIGNDSQKQNHRRCRGPSFAKYRKLTRPCLSTCILPTLCSLYLIIAWYSAIFVHTGNVFLFIYFFPLIWEHKVPYQTG